jgi:hypothetical protein
LAALNLFTAFAPLRSHGKTVSGNLPVVQEWQLEVVTVAAFDNDASDEAVDFSTSPAVPYISWLARG